ncbi:hypothetical protein [Yersinia enterocolitica]|uniref:hypothetical protein n=1 Tax=Yersinia enterocolitica TaxID=630 RepID=UPI003D0618C4
MFNRLKSLLVKSGYLGREMGNVNFDGALISRSNKLAYRYDSRSPDVIKVTGFFGTMSRDIEEIRIFGPNNVFSSRTKEGAEAFLKINKFIGQEKTQYLYEINTYELQTFSFIENYKKNPIKLIQNIADLALQGQLQGLPKEQVMLLADSALKEQFNFVDELHINGPICSSRIKHIATTFVK